MAVNIANIQLTVLQLPQVAHDHTPAMQAAQIASAQAPALIRQQDEKADRTVQESHQAEGNQVGDATTGNGAEYESYRRPPRGEAETPKARAKPAPHPLGLGAMVDIQI